MYKVLWLRWIKFSIPPPCIILRSRSGGVSNRKMAIHKHLHAADGAVILEQSINRGAPLIMRIFRF